MNVCGHSSSVRCAVELGLDHFSLKRLLRLALAVFGGPARPPRESRRCAAFLRTCVPDCPSQRPVSWPHGHALDLAADGRSRHATPRPLSSSALRPMTSGSARPPPPRPRFFLDLRLRRSARSPRRDRRPASRPAAACMSPAVSESPIFRSLMFNSSLSGIASASHSISTSCTKCSTTPPSFAPGGLAAQLDGHLDFDPLVLRDAGEIDVQHVRAVGVPLQVADEGLFVDGALELDDAAAVPHDRGHLVGRHGQADGWPRRGHTGPPECCRRGAAAALRACRATRAP